MRQSLAKGTRRALRRSMGDGALETIHQQDQAIGILSAGFAACQREIATLALHHAEVTKQTRAEVTAERFACQQARCTLIATLPRTQTFYGRLRWLVTGR